MQYKCLQVASLASTTAGVALLSTFASHGSASLSCYPRVLVHGVENQDSHARWVLMVTVCSFCVCLLGRLISVRMHVWVFRQWCAVVQALWRPTGIWDLLKLLWSIQL